MQSQPASEDSAEWQSQACLAVLMPIYNEIATLREVITQVLTQPDAKLLQPLVQQEADVVYGSRYLDMRVRKEAYFGQYFANQILTFLTNSLRRLNTTDMATSYKVFRSEIFSRIEIEEAGFGVCPELTVKIGRLGLRFVELPISYSPRSFADGKKITWKDGLKAIECIVKYGLRRPNNDDRTKA
ncbi:MAG TPA: hypothetical protein VN957_29915 [Chthoniobacterales bacterium]|jgi:glycosyltransferase involved in cell wall biosynthesis|nr:hypothetical protein [Chthoniobacterales bacterium]